MKLGVVGKMGLFFALIGLLFTGAGATFLYVNYSFTQTAIHTTGLVVRYAQHDSDGTTMYTPVVMYTAESGEEITFKGSFSSSRKPYSLQEEVTVLYKTEGDVVSSKIAGESRLVSYIFVGLGSIFTLVGGGMVYARYRRHKLNLWLQSNGMPVQAQVHGVQLNTTVTYMGRHPFQIRARYHDGSGGEGFTFVSENIWYDPTELLGETVTVWVDTADYGRYNMDISFLPDKR